MNGDSWHVEGTLAKIWRGLTRRSNRKKQSYDITRLVDRRVHDQVVSDIHIVCDIDKTYLETEFESLVKIARIAFEEAADKITVRGAADILLAFRWGYMAPGELLNDTPRALHFISSSPPQLRSVLSEKLLMDGLDWSSDTFKNQAYNLRVGRVDLLRQHIAYKVCAILQLIGQYPVSGKVFFIGDNAESDAYIYLGIKLFLERRLDADGFRSYLGSAGVDLTIVDDIIGQLVDDRPDLTVGGILIREVPGYQLKRVAPLTDAVTSFENYLSAALLLHRWGVISSKTFPNLVRRFHNHHGFGRERLHSVLAAYAEQLDKPDSSLDELTSALSVEGTAAPSTDGFESLPLEQFDGLGQDDILRLAKDWFGVMKEGH